jgi:hypothetical protein
VGLPFSIGAWVIATNRSVATPAITNKTRVVGSGGHRRSRPDELQNERLLAGAQVSGWPDLSARQPLWSRSRAHIRRLLGHWNGAGTQHALRPQSVST